MNTTFLSTRDFILDRLHLYISKHNRKLSALYDEILLLAPESENCIYRLISICPDSICDSDGTALVHKAVYRCLLTLQRSPVFKNQLNDSLFVICTLCKELADAIFTLAAVEINTSNGPWTLDLALTDSYSQRVFNDTCIIYDSKPYIAADKDKLLAKLTEYLLSAALKSLKHDNTPLPALRISAVQ